MASENEPIEQYTEIFLLKEIRMTLKEIRDNVQSIARIIVAVSIIAFTMVMGVLIGNLLSALL